MEQDASKDHSRINEIKEHFIAYVKTKLAYYKLSAIEGVSLGAGFAILAVLLFLFFLLTIIFLSVSAAVAIGHALGSLAIGFLIVAGIYILIMTILVVFREALLIVPISRKLISTLAAKLEDQ